MDQRPPSASMPAVPGAPPSPPPGTVTRPLQAATDVASRQHGLLSVDQARRCGVREPDVRRLLRQGTWGRPYPRVYSVRVLLDDTDEHRRLRTAAMAAQLALGPASFAAAETAARLWRLQGLPSWNGREIHMVIPALGAQRHIRGITLHSWDTASSEVAHLGAGLRGTTPARTLRDVLPRVDRDTGVCLIDSALNQGLVKAEELPLLERANRGRRGCRKVREWWPLVDGRAQSALETRIRLICIDGGMPPGALQHRFRNGEGRTIAVVDFWWPDRLLIAEADGLGPHGTAQAVARDRERQNALQLWHPGVRIVRFTWADLARPRYILATVAAAGR